MAIVAQAVLGPLYACEEFLMGPVVRFIVARLRSEAPLIAHGNFSFRRSLYFSRHFRPISGSHVSLGVVKVGSCSYLDLYVVLLGKKSFEAKQRVEKG